MAASFEYAFPAIRGVQAKREYYVSMCPLRLIPKIFVFNEEELPPELRAQRTLNKSRLPEIARYILDNRESYTFSALTASIDGEVRFKPLEDSTKGGNDDGKQVGRIYVPMSARFIVNDGQHRRAAIEMALRENPEMGDESIAVVFFLDRGLERCQQMFADLNRHAIRPSKSIGVLYDHRDQMAKLAKLVVLKSTLFRDVVDMERSTLSLRSRKLFTLSAIYTATCALFSSQEPVDLHKGAEVALDFWGEVAKQFPEWQQVKDRRIVASEVRGSFIHSHGIALQAIGHVGRALLTDHPRGWRRQLKNLRDIDWSRSNSAIWEGRAMVGGRLSKSEVNVILTTNLLKKHLSLPLSPEEQRIEDAFLRGEHADN
jgi:DNA sulfur modification protein DndB